MVVETAGVLLLEYSMRTALPYLPSVAWEAPSPSVSKLMSTHMQSCGALDSSGDREGS